jgi:hypothetical protein
MGVDQSILVTVDAGNGGTFDMIACVRDPGRAQVDASIDQMLNTVSVNP